MSTQLRICSKSLLQYDHALQLQSVVQDLEPPPLLPLDELEDELLEEAQLFPTQNATSNKLPHVAYTV